VWLLFIYLVHTKASDQTELEQDLDELHAGIDVLQRLWVLEKHKDEGHKTAGASVNNQTINMDCRLSLE